jgi:hypothetical protein
VARLFELRAAESQPPPPLAVEKPKTRHFGLKNPFQRAHLAGFQPSRDARAPASTGLKGRNQLFPANAGGEKTFYTLTNATACSKNQSIPPGGIKTNRLLSFGTLRDSL